MFNFTKSVKRYASLFLLLSASVSTQAINTFTVNTTSSEKTGSTGNSGSIMDAAQIVSADIDGQWEIVFDCEGEITLSDPIKFSGLTELDIVGNGKITISTSSASYPKRAFEFYNIGTLNIDDVDFKVSDISYEQKCYFYANDTKIGHLKGCDFEGVNLTLTKNIGTISDCNFTNSRGLELGNEEMGLTIELIKNCTFTNCYRAMDRANGAQEYQVTKMTGCTFNSNNEGDKYNNIVYNGYFKEVSDCKFNSSYSLRDDQFSPNKCDIIKNCEFNECHSALNNSEYDSIANVKFNNCISCLQDVIVNGINHCEFNNCSYGIDAPNEKTKIGTIENSTFSSSGYCIYGKVAIEKISYCKFTHTGELEHSNIYLTYTETIPLIWETDFINDCAFISLRDYSGVAPGIRRCRFLHEGNLVQAISGDLIPVPKLTSAVLKKGKYIISGTAEPGAIIDLYENKGFRKTTTKYLITNDVNDDGSFNITIAADEVTSPNFIVSATYNEKGTSDLSNTISYTEPTLEILGDAKDNTCSTPNSEVNITVTGWEAECTATLNGQEVTPNKTNGNVASFVFNNLEGGNYDFIAVNESAELRAIFNFELTTIEDISNVELNFNNTRQKCVGVDNAQVQIGYSGIPDGGSIKVTLKGDNYSKTYTDVKRSGNLIYYDVPVGEYEVVIEAENDECAEPKSMGKLNVTSLKKTKIDPAGLSIDEKIVNGEGRKIFQLVINNYLKGDEVTVYHDGEAIKRVVEPAETADANPSDKLSLHYTSDCPVDKGLYDFVFLDWGNAEGGHYKVEVKDKCGQIVSYEFDIDECTPLDLSNFDAQLYATRQQCAGNDDGQIQVSYSGNVDGQKLKMTIKNGSFEKAYTTGNGAGNFLYHDVPAGTYEVFVSPEEAETVTDCPFSTKSLGKITVAETPMPSIPSLGLVIDESKQYISLLIRNYLNKDVVDVYRDEKLDARFTVATEGKSDLRDKNLFYTDECGKDGNYFDFVFLEMKNAESGHYKVQVKDQCNQTVEFEFDASFETTGLDVISSDDELVDVHNVLGICLKRGVKRSEALKGLNPGIYVVGNEQVIKSTVK
ncbi:MAG: hypothetical protein J5554_14770 [Paludibacteraceae bacterium]|nr:hypothetical protein [Paludibacteraceae bacterium]